MLLNFALDVLGTSVTSDKVSTDGHECTNLIHTDYLTRRKGYLTESFVKPPVHITFTFPCNVNISHVVLEPYVGQQQSIQLELLCATKPIAKTSHGKLLQKVNMLKPNKSTSLNEAHLPAFHPVSKFTSSTLSPVCFYNPRLNSCRHSFSMEHQNKSEMRHSKVELLCSATHIMIRIVRTQRGLTAALNNVEIWGCVSSSVCQEMRKSVEGKYINFVTPTKPSSDSTAEQSESESKKDISNINKSSKIESLSRRNDDLEIPEEFLDPITCEVMTIPMLLPCGKNIDKSSLDRFSDSEATHGRQPRDPFTGMEFSAVIKPIPNVDLKARIDSFLMSNSNIKSLESIPRTVGPGISRSCLLGKRKQNISSLVGAPDDKKATKNNVNNRDGTNSVRNVLTKAHSSQDEMVRNKSTNVGDSESSSSSLLNVQYQKSNNIGESHDDRLKDSLDSALSSLLSNVSSVRNRKQPMTSPDDRLCICCGVVLLSNMDIAYATPCFHLLCRKCLLSLSNEGQEISCKKCGNKFKKTDVVRSH